MGLTETERPRLIFLWSFLHFSHMNGGMYGILTQGCLGGSQWWDHPPPRPSLALATEDIQSDSNTCIAFPNDCLDSPRRGILSPCAVQKQVGQWHWIAVGVDLPFGAGRSLW